MSDGRITVFYSQDWTPRIGGAHHWLQEIARRWEGQCKVLTATPNSERTGRVGPSPSDLTVLRTAEPIHSISMRPTSWGALVRNSLILRRLAGTEMLELHCKAFFPEGIVGWLACRWWARRTRLIVYAHGEEVLVAKSSRLLSWIARIVYRRAHRVIANSVNTEQLVQSLQPSAQTSVVHPGVDSSQFFFTPEQRAKFRGQHGITDSTFLVLSVGRMEPRKNFIAVARAIEKARRRGLDVSYVCIGEGEDRHRLEAISREPRESNWFRVLDPVEEEEKRRWFLAADLFAMPSVQRGEMIEGFGIVFLEASAAGTPSISGLSGGQREAVIDGQTGWNVDGESIDAIEGAITNLHSDLCLRQKMKRECLKWAADHDWSNAVSRVKRAVQE